MRKIEKKVVVFFEEPDRGVRGGWVIEIIVGKDFVQDRNLKPSVEKSAVVRFGRRIARNLGIPFSVQRR